jgi:hypothetical protein
MTSRRKLVANLLLALISTALALLMAEGLVRLLLSARGGGRERDERSAYILADPRLGWRKRPGARVLYHRYEYTTEVAINAEGLRDPERSIVAPRGTRRVLSLGDSFLEGYSVSLAQTVTQDLERQISRPGCPVEVINGGTTGYSTDQEYLFYLDDGQRYGSEWVLLFFHYNDIFYNGERAYWRLPKPRLTLTAQGLQLDNVPLPAFKASNAPPAVKAGPLPACVLCEWIPNQMRRGAPEAYNRLAGLGLWEPCPTEDPGDELLVYRQRPPHFIKGAWVLTAHILEALAREVEKRGGRFAVVYVPSAMEVNNRAWELTRIHYGLDEVEWNRGAVIARLESVGRNKGFPVLDLTPALRERERHLWSPTYFTQDQHWNARGHHTAAMAVAEFLRSQGWPPPCSRSGDGPSSP